jgi:hypothetical protein
MTPTVVNANVDGTLDVHVDVDIDGMDASYRVHDCDHVYVYGYVYDVR